MSKGSLELNHFDRLLVLAPHPDDETLGAGGLIQRAKAQGAAVRVVFLTRGDNNPWPQRLAERKWIISEADRRAWGERREREALAGLGELGIEPCAVTFLGFPDQGLTKLLLSAPEKVCRALSGALTEFRPTIVAGPSPGDLHPDHNSGAVLLQLAIDLSRLSPLLYFYRIHGAPFGSSRAGSAASVDLTSDEIDAKRKAVLRHESQLLFGKDRFLRYAQPIERYEQPGEGLAYPFAGTSLDRGVLTLALSKRHVMRRVLQARLLLVGFDGNSMRTHTRPLEPPAGNRLVLAENRELPAGFLSSVTKLFVKLEQQLIFCDEAGWVEICPARYGALGK